MLKPNDYGLYCEVGGFYIDPWKPVDKAIITHAHADHSRPGSKYYLAHKDSFHVMKYRLGRDIYLETIEYDEPININGVKVSLHPAGHVLGSAQVRLEYKGEVWVVTGDYKTQHDKTCIDFEPIKCNTFITESTFGLPVYKWQNEREVFHEINNWWAENKKLGRTSLIFGYSFGKGQRIITNLDTSIGKIYTHGGVENINSQYRKTGVSLPETIYVSDTDKRDDYIGNIVVAPPSADNSGWARRFKNLSKGYASGWMMVRGNRRRRSVDRGFILSDHADWDGLIDTIKATGAETVMPTHGYTNILSRYLNDIGINSVPLETQYEGETDAD